MRKCIKLTVAFLKLVRWPNLVFIILTQVLFYYAVFFALATNETPVMYNRLFVLLVLASVLIAAAGYIINDYFDLFIDRINKPEKLIIDKVLKRRWTIVWHWVLSTAGVAISAYISYMLRNPLILMANILCTFLLWFYSTHFKKMLLIGNIIVALMLAWVIVVVYFFADADFVIWLNVDSGYNKSGFFKLTVLYAGFAFILTLIREVVKDLEDMNGDARYECNTMPIAWGVPATKVYTGVWVVVCIASLIILSIYVFLMGFLGIALYTFFLIILPLIQVLYKLYHANSQSEYHQISKLIKWIILAGILSMLFFFKF